jgi:hypothetical protein
MITVFPLALVTETQSALLTAFSVGCQAAITFVSGTNISNAKPTVHSARSYVRYLGERCHKVSFIFICITACSGAGGP